MAPRFSTDSRAQTRNVELGSIKQFQVTNMLERSAKSGANLAYQSSEISSRGSNNRASSNAAIAACVHSKHAATETRSRGRGFATG